MGFKYKMKTNKILNSLVVGSLMLGLFILGSGASVASLDLEVYTEVSLASDPGWQRSVTIEDLGEEVKFKVNIKNLTAGAVDNVMVKFEPAAGFEFADNTVTVIKNGGTTYYGTSDLVSASGLNIGSLDSWDPGVDFAEVIFKIKLSFCPWTSLYRSGIRVDSDQTDEAVDQVDIGVNAVCEGLFLEKLVSNTNNPEWKAQVNADHGDYIQYKVRLHNPNPLPMTEPRLKDVLPDGFTLREDTVFLIFGGNTMSPNPVNGDIFGDGYLLSTNLDPYNSPDRPYWEIVYKARVGECPVEGDKVNKASAWAKWTDAVYASATVVVPLCPTPTPTPTPGTCQLSIDKKIVWNGREYDHIDRGTHLFDAGDEVVYKFYVKNEGDAEATGVQLIDHLPNHIRDLDGRDEKEFNIGTLAAGESWEDEYTTKVSEDIPQNDRTQENRATVDSNEGCSDEDTAFIWINGPEILAAEAVAAVAEELPATGPAVPITLGLSGLFSIGFYLHRRLV